MLQGSPGEINSPALQHEPSRQWLGQRRCGRAAWQGLAFAVWGQIAWLRNCRKKKAIFFHFPPLFLFLSSPFLLVSGDGKNNHCLSQADLKTAETTDFNARWEKTGGGGVGRQSLLTSTKDCRYFSLFPPICQGEPQGEKSSAALSCWSEQRTSLLYLLLRVSWHFRYQNTGHGGGQETVKHWKEEGRRWQLKYLD